MMFPLEPGTGQQVCPLLSTAVAQASRILLRVVLHKHVLLCFAAKQLLLSHKGCDEGRGFQVQLRGAEAAEGRNAEGAEVVVGVVTRGAKEPGAC